MDCVTAGNVMVQLFMQTKPKYFLNNQKLQYLLCIAQMTSLATGNPLYNEPIRNLKNNFTLEKIADNFIYNKPIQEGITEQITLDLKYGDFSIPFSSKRLYAIKENLSEEEKRLLIDVFIRFGAHDEKSLCKKLNEFKPLRDVGVWSYITVDKLNDFISEVIASGNLEYSKNEIFSLYHEYSEKDLIDESCGSNKTESEATDIAVETDEVGHLPEIAAPPIYGDVLKGHLELGLKKIVAGRKYSLYIEPPSQTPLKDVIVMSLKDNFRIIGDLNKINDTIYRYTFDGIASDIKISIDI